MPMFRMKLAFFRLHPSILPQNVQVAPGSMTTAYRCGDLVDLCRGCRAQLTLWEREITRIVGSVGELVVLIRMKSRCSSDLFGQQVVR
jgi:hypothetical protein